MTHFLGVIKQRNANDCENDENKDELMKNENKEHMN